MAEADTGMSNQQAAAPAPDLSRDAEAIAREIMERVPAQKAEAIAKALERRLLNQRVGSVDPATPWGRVLLQR